MPPGNQRRHAGGGGRERVREKKTKLKWRRNRLKIGLGPVDQLLIRERRADEYRYRLGGRGHRVHDRKGRLHFAHLLPFARRRTSDSQQKLKSAEKFYDLKVKELGDNLKELEGIVQTKQMNVRTI